MRTVSPSLTVMDDGLNSNCFAVMVKVLTSDFVDSFLEVSFGVSSVFSSDFTSVLTSVFNSVFGAEVEVSLLESGFSDGVSVAAVDSSLPPSAVFSDSASSFSVYSSIAPSALSALSGLGFLNASHPDRIAINVKLKSVTEIFFNII